MLFCIAMLPMPSARLIAIACGVVLWADDQTSAFARTAIDRFDDVDELLFVFKHPIELVVVASAEIAHHVLVAVEEHDRHWVVEFVHLVLRVIVSNDRERMIGELTKSGT